MLETYETSVLCSAPRAVRRAALRLLIAPHADPSRECIAACEQMLERGGSRDLSADASFCVKQGLARVELRCETDFWPEIPFAEGEYELRSGTSIIIRRISLEKYEKMGKEAQNPLFSCVDYDKMKTGTLLRRRRAGDRFAPPGRGKPTTLKKVLNEQRLTAAARSGLVLAAAGNRVLWALGFGASREVLPGPDTREVAVITIRKRGKK